MSELVEYRVCLVVSRQSVSWWLSYIMIWVRIYPYNHIRKCLHGYVYIYIHTYIYIYMYTYVDAYIHYITLHYTTIKKKTYIQHVSTHISPSMFRSRRQLWSHGGRAKQDLADLVGHAAARAADLGLHQRRLERHGRYEQILFLSLYIYILIKCCSNDVWFYILS